MTFFVEKLNYYIVYLNRLCVLTQGARIIRSCFWVPILPIPKQDFFFNLVYFQALVYSLPIDGIKIHLEKIVLAVSSANSCGTPLYWSLSLTWLLRLQVVEQMLQNFIWLLIRVYLTYSLLCGTWCIHSNEKKFQLRSRENLFSVQINRSHST